MQLCHAPCLAVFESNVASLARYVCISSSTLLTIPSAALIRVWHQVNDSLHLQRDPCTVSATSLCPISRDNHQHWHPFTAVQELREEVFNKVERLFLIGLRASDPETRHKFFALYDRVINRALYDRMQFVIVGQEWASMSQQFWLKQALDLILSISKDDEMIMLAPNSAKIAPLMQGLKANVYDNRLPPNAQHVKGTTAGPHGRLQTAASARQHQQQQQQQQPPGQPPAEQQSQLQGVNSQGQPASESVSGLPPPAAPGHMSSQQGDVNATLGAAQPSANQTASSTSGPLPPQSGIPPGSSALNGVVPAVAGPADTSAIGGAGDQSIQATQMDVDAVPAQQQQQQLGSTALPDASASQPQVAGVDQPSMPPPSVGGSIQQAAQQPTAPSLPQAGADGAAAAAAGVLLQPSAGLANDSAGMTAGSGPPAPAVANGGAPPGFAPCPTAALTQIGDSGTLTAAPEASAAVPSAPTGTAAPLASAPSPAPTTAPSGATAVGATAGTQEPQDSEKQPITVRDGEVPELVRGMLNNHVQFLEDAGNLTVADMMFALREYAHVDSHVAYHLWVLIFPIVWQTLEKYQQINLAKPIISLLSKECHQRQAMMRPNIIQVSGGSEQTV